MPFYHRLGQIPPKRHIQFRKPDGGLYFEELVSTEGFNSHYSLVYHVHPPTQVSRIGAVHSMAPQVVVQNNAQHRCLLGFQHAPADDYLHARRILMCNADVQIAVAAPRHSMTGYFYKNATADELVFVHEGSGTLYTAFGELAFEYGDYIHIPRGTVHQFRFDGPENRLLIVESSGPLAFPKRYLSRYGQLMEHSPFCERDLKLPVNLATHDESGDFQVLIKKYHDLVEYHYASHPFDYVGWDGYLFPYIFSIHNFEPITGRVHQPPPVHQTFEAHNFVVCSFVPRLFDYHPLAIPAPYAHSNVDSDEVLYYVDGDFMSRKHVEKGMFTLHPIGLPHGPHPGTIEKSIGAKETRELAVMIDTFRPLWLTQQALDVEQPDYWSSWH